LSSRDWQAFRKVRLAALRDAPSAFGSTWENEKERSDEEWQQALTSRSRFVAELNGRIVGLAAGGESGPGGVAALTSLWVDPDARGQGVGDQLVMTVTEWAKAAGFGQVVLWVTEGNFHAESLYERNGFTRTGEVIHEPRPEFEMWKRI
jgi:ribosomal protein S18 acetylase RimI-like enzyme